MVIFDQLVPRFKKHNTNVPPPLLKTLHTHVFLKYQSWLQINKSKWKHDYDVISVSERGLYEVKYLITGPLALVNCLLTCRATPGREYQILLLKIVQLRLDDDPTCVSRHILGLLIKITPSHIDLFLLNQLTDWNFTEKLYPTVVFIVFIYIFNIYK